MSAPDLNGDTVTSRIVITSSPVLRLLRDGEAISGSTSRNGMKWQTEVDGFQAEAED